MQRAAATVLKGVAWVLLAGVPYVLLGALFAPRLVQFLNPAVCGKVGYLTNRAAGSDSIELACRGDGNPNVTIRIVVVLLLLVVAAAICISLANRLLHPRTRVVTAEAHR